MIKQDHVPVHNIQASLPGVSYILYGRLSTHTYMLSEGKLCATTGPARDGLACTKLRHRQRSKGCIAIDLTLIMLRCSASNPTIDKLPDRAVRLFSDNSMPLARFLFLKTSHVFMQLGDYSPCVGTL